MIQLLIGLLLVMGANILLGTTLAQLQAAFDKTTFINGITKALCIALALVLMFICASLNPTILVANISGNNVNLFDGMKLIFTAGIVIYGAKDLAKLKDVFQIDVATKDTSTDTSTDNTTK